MRPTRIRDLIMNLNPFVFHYKNYPNSKLATAVSAICGALQRLFFLYFIGMSLALILSDISNWGEALAADIVMFLYRDGYYNKDKSEDVNLAECIVAKNRHGETVRYAEYRLIRGDADAG